VSRFLRAARGVQNAGKIVKEDTMDLAQVSDRIHPYADIAVLIGILLALAAIVVALLQLKDAHKTAAEQMDASNQYAIAQNWIALRAILTTYDDIHANLRPRGNWHRSKEKPDTVQDWARTELYMGTFEFMEELVEKKMLDLDHVNDWYRYRVEHIILNPRIARYKLIDYSDSWRRFNKLRVIFGLPEPKRQEGLAPFIRD
jgi:hypothetical protein